MFRHLYEMLGVRDGEMFTCKNTIYSVDGGKLLYRSSNGWKEASHSEVVYVYSKRDLIAPYVSPASRESSDECHHDYECLGTKTVFDVDGPATRMVVYRCRKCRKLSNMPFIREG